MMTVNFEQMSMQFDTTEFSLRRNAPSTKWIWYWEDSDGWKKYAETKVSTLLFFLFKIKRTTDSYTTHFLLLFINFSFYFDRYNNTTRLAPSRSFFLCIYSYLNKIFLKSSAKDRSNKSPLKSRARDRAGFCERARDGKQMTLAEVWLATGATCVTCRKWILADALLPRKYCIVSFALSWFLLSC